MTYRVKVSKEKSPRSLWGGPGVIQALTGTKLYLFLRVDDNGETITVEKKPTSTNPAAPVADLNAGECFVVPLDSAVAILASCKLDTFVYCTIFASA
jgi:hypothetical protein